MTKRAENTPAARGCAPVLCALLAMSLPGGSALADDAAERGKQLVQIHCIRCHDAPDPSELPKEVWPIRLSDMGMYLGFEPDTLPDIVSAEPTETPFTQLATFKAQGADGVEYNLSAYKRYRIGTPIISLEDWLSIRSYFVENAKTLEEMVLPQPDHPTLSGFEVQIPKLEIEPNSLVISTRVDRANDLMYVGRSIGRQMFVMKEGTEDVLAIDLDSGKRLARREMKTAPTFIELTDNGIRLAGHGEFPPERGNGQAFITDLDNFATGEWAEHMLVYGRHRIIQLYTLDMNGDGRDDIVTNMFGDGINSDFGGSLTVFWQEPEFTRLRAAAPEQIPAGPLEGALREDVLLDQVGIISSTVADLDGDGDTDIAALAAQGHQQVIVYWNSGNGSFQKQILARHGPAFGGNTIYAADVDGDGNVDLTYLNGDNVAANFVGQTMNKPKPYHGVRVLRNLGGHRFEEAYFYAMHGALRAALADFDGDGDQDIAAISLYPDWRWEVPETFVYLENVGDFQFRPASLAREHFAIWLSVEAADVNSDGRPDIVLGLGDWPLFTPDDWKTRKIVTDGLGPNGEVPAIMYLLSQD